MDDRLSLRQFLPYRCNSLAQRISVSLSRIYVQRFGITVPEWRALVTLAEYGELQSKQIAAQTDMDKVRVSRAVATMTDKGLISRRPCDRDSRAAYLKLTDEGLALYRRIVPEALAWEEQLLAPLSPAERESLFGLLDKLDGRLSELSSGR
ncbi:MarR family winged helix-turn-helix transcriptional regulator [Parahaliea mediterranea]|uniref:MarR family transcriptional regulator n=1 Tax=Parahaliea mediterranea TaxID=651086 RepID=A0A939DBK2_9GAMM|nr:MarR family transcriptional regulator [Parahaliea mediterranea]MBN7795049.1 MarR family transcriptional regulator [Parahaliea mediterranea]